MPKKSRSRSYTRKQSNRKSKTRSYSRKQSGRKSRQSTKRLSNLTADAKEYYDTYVGNIDTQRSQSYRMAIRALQGKGSLRDKVKELANLKGYDDMVGITEGNRLYGLVKNGKVTTFIEFPSKGGFVVRKRKGRTSIPYGLPSTPSVRSVPLLPSTKSTSLIQIFEELNINKTRPIRALTSKTTPTTTVATTTVATPTVATPTVATPTTVETPITIETPISVIEKAKEEANVAMDELTEKEKAFTSQIEVLKADPNSEELNKKVEIAKEELTQAQQNVQQKINKLSSLSEKEKKPKLLASRQNQYNDCEKECSFIKTEDKTDVPENSKLNYWYASCKNDINKEVFSDAKKCLDRQIDLGKLHRLIEIWDSIEEKKQNDIITYLFEYKEPEKKVSSIMDWIDEGGGWNYVEFFINKAKQKQLNVFDDEGHTLLYHLVKKAGGKFSLIGTYSWKNVEYLINKGADIYIDEDIKTVAGPTWFADMVILQPPLLKFSQSGGRHYLKSIHQNRKI
jgi:hypothetical protein